MYILDPNNYNDQQLMKDLLRDSNGYEFSILMADQIMVEKQECFGLHVRPITGEEFEVISWQVLDILPEFRILGGAIFTDLLHYMGEV